MLWGRTCRRPDLLSRSTCKLDSKFPVCSPRLRRLPGQLEMTSHQTKGLLRTSWPGWTLFGTPGPPARVFHLLSVTCSLPQATITQAIGASQRISLCVWPTGAAEERVGRPACLPAVASLIRGAASKGMLLLSHLLQHTHQNGARPLSVSSTVCHSHTPNCAGFTTAAASVHLHAHLLTWYLPPSAQPHTTASTCCSCLLPAGLLPFFQLLHNPHATMALK